MKKDTLWRLARLLVILLGIGILVYPSFSEYLSELNGSRATASYDDSVLQMEQAHLDDLLAQAQEYNRQLAQVSAGQVPQSDADGNPITPESYWDLLNVDSAGMMGYIEIPKLSTTIPIYHGTSEAVLQVGIGHLQNTSLPVGGESTHAALSGHRGLPTRSLFTDLDKMEIGDRFYIKILNETLCYTVDQILTVLPSEMEALAIEEGRDYVTLITCTPYGINSHRLLVRGVRTPYDPQQHQAEKEDVLPLWQRMPMQYRHMLIGAAVLVLVLFLRGLILLIFKFRKRRRQRHE